jgi:hypothetical protein
MTGMPTIAALPATETPHRRYHHPAMSSRPDAVNKIGVLADVAGEIYHTYADAKATQLIYCETVMVYAEIKRELILRGIPAAEIAFIQEYATKTRKAALFAAVNAGTIRVLLASKQSTGMNVQQRLIALHHLDCPWRPGDLEQREGRIVRQGNAFPEVMIFAYVTEGSFDGYRWQTIETKASFIEQMKRGDVSMREVDDLGDAVLSAAEIKALASGNPLIMIKVKLDLDVQKLEAEAAGDRDNRVRMRKSLLGYRAERERIQQRIPFLSAAQEFAESHATKEFKAAIINGVFDTAATAYSKREAAGEAVLKVLRELDAYTANRGERQSMLIGQYQGFELRGNSYMAGMPDLFVMFEYQGERRSLSATSISLKTALGVFQSIDHHIRDIAGEIGRAEARIAELEQDEAKINALLDIPWPKAEELSEKRVRLEQINNELMQDGKPHIQQGTPPAARTEATPPGERAELSVATLVIVAESAADHILEPIPSQPEAIERPIIILPTASNQVAMDAAIHCLRGGVTRPIPTIHVEASEPSTPPSAGALEITEVMDIPPHPITIPAKAHVPLFGTILPPTRNLLKAIPTAPAPASQAELFAPHAFQQATLW